MTDLKPTRLRNHGRVFPVWLDTTNPEAQRGTTRLRAIDPNLTAGLDSRRGVMMVWGPSLEFGGWIPICDCQDDRGVPFRGHIPWEIILAELREAREGTLSADRVLAAQDRQMQERDAFLSRQAEEGAAFYRQAVAGEVSGSGRFSAEDVGQAWRRQVHGEKPAPKGQIISLPG